MALLEIKNLHVALEDGTEIVKGVDLAVDRGQMHAIMGPNGSGKSTLAYALMGHPGVRGDGGPDPPGRTRTSRSSERTSVPSAVSSSRSSTRTPSLE